VKGRSQQFALPDGHDGAIIQPGQHLNPGVDLLNNRGADEDGVKRFATKCRYR
jgi:hypothetical protein